MIVAVSMVKDEGDIIMSCVRHLLAQGVDELIIADNGSTDDTRDILNMFPEVTVIDDNEVAYYQSAKVTALAHRALEEGADWVLPFDADELWIPVEHATIRSALEAASCDVVAAQVFRHVPRADMEPGNPHVSMPWREADPERMRSVAFRPRAGMLVKQGNHDVIGVGGVRDDSLLAVREFQYRSLEQMTRKVRNGKAAYDATTMSEYEGAHWRRLGAMSDEQLLAEWEWLCGVPAVYDPAPVTWQTA